jgi:UDPglucose 6-dehydrogenase
LNAVERANERQKMVLVERIVERFGGDLRGHTFALWGLAFKPDTDDMRQAPSRVIIDALLSRGAHIRAHDPVAMDEARRVFAGVANVEFAATPNDAVEGADALVVVTEWKAYRSPDFERLRSHMRQAVVFDGRNLFDPDSMQALGFEYMSIGRGAVVPAVPPNASQLVTEVRVEHRLAA